MSFIFYYRSFHSQMILGGQMSRGIVFSKWMFIPRFVCASKNILVPNWIINIPFISCAVNVLDRQQKHIHRLLFLCPSFGIFSSIFLLLSLPSRSFFEEEKKFLEFYYSRSVPLTILLIYNLSNRLCNVSLLYHEIKFYPEEVFLRSYIYIYIYISPPLSLYI